MSLYWDRNIPNRSIFSSGTAIRLELLTETPFSIIVSQSSPYNPDLHVGDIILAIDGVHVPAASDMGENQHLRVFEMYRLTQLPFFVRLKRSLCSGYHPLSHPCLRPSLPSYSEAKLRLGR